MTFLPIVERELRVAARRRATYWSRSVTAVLAIVTGAIVYGKFSDEPPHEVGTDLFMVLTWLAYLYCLVVGVSSTADCLSEEKREGTLGLLFLTDLKGYDVVVGKLVATSLNSFFGLVAIFPVLAVPLLMGGVTYGECGRGALVLANTFLFSLALGMFMSSLFVSPSKARAATLILVLFFALGIPILRDFTRYLPGMVSWHQALTLVCPDTPMLFIIDAQYSASRAAFWEPIAAVHALSWLCLGLACVIVPRSWQDKAGGARFQRWRNRWHNLNYGDTNERRAFRKRLLDLNAFYWLAARVRLKPGYVWAALCVCAGLWSWGAFEERRDWLDVGVYFLTAIVLNCTLKVWIASEAGHRLGADRQAGALELVLSTPITVGEIIRGQLLALRRQFLGPLIAVVIAQTILLLLSLQGGRTGGEDVTLTVMYGVGFMVMLLADMAALSCVAMWASLSAKNPLRSSGVAMRRILLLPWACIGAFYLMGWIFEQMFRRYEFTMKSFLVLYCVVGLVIDVWFGARAWQRLHSEFRDLATRRFEIRRSFWGRIFGSGKSSKAF